MESREFLFVICPRGSGLPGRKATIKFVTSRGESVDFFAEHQHEFKIDCGKYITFRLQEITYGKFALLDWDQSMQESRLDYLDATLNLEISNRISAVSDLSVRLSGEIDSLSAKLSEEVGDLKNLVGRTIDDPGNSKPGVVKMVDEHHYDGESGLRNYEMHMISGTIMLRLI